MKFIQGHNRTQINLLPVSLDQSIDSENEVRIIDLFVDSLSIKEYGFRMDFIENGSQIMVCNNITEVTYSVQTTVDAKKCIPTGYKVTNQNDSKAMDNMVQRANSLLRTNGFTVLYDKGYHTWSELKIAQDLGVETIVAIPAIPSSGQAPDPDYNFERFT
jgi:hypothetical protein